jgi:hypothetical protein
MFSELVYQAIAHHLPIESGSRELLRLTCWQARDGIRPSMLNTRMVLMSDMPRRQLQWVLGDDEELVRHAIRNLYMTQFGARGTMTLDELIVEHGLDPDEAESGNRRRDEVATGYYSPTLPDRWRAVAIEVRETMARMQTRAREIAMMYLVRDECMFAYSARYNAGLSVSALDSVVLLSAFVPTDEFTVNMLRRMAAERMIPDGRHILGRIMANGIDGEFLRYRLLLYLQWRMPIGADYPSDYTTMKLLSVPVDMSSMNADDIMYAATCVDTEHLVQWLVVSGELRLFKALLERDLSGRVAFELAALGKSPREWGINGADLGKAIEWALTSMGVATVRRSGPLLAIAPGAELARIVFETPCDAVEAIKQGNWSEQQCRLARRIAELFGYDVVIDVLDAV